MSTNRTRSGRRQSPGDLGTVRQSSSGRWIAYYRMDGETFRAPRTFVTKAEGLAWLAQERATRHRGSWHDPRIGQTTLADYAREWLDARAHLAPRTRDNYRHSLERWLVPAIGTPEGRTFELGRYELGAITPAVVRSWYSVLIAATNRSAQHRYHRAPRTHPARRWARVNGYPVKAQGLLPRVVREAWEAAGSPDVPEVAESPISTDHRQAGRTTSAHAYRLLHAIMATAHRDGLIMANPCRIDGAGTVHHPERTIATPAEVDALTAAFPETLSAAVLLAAWSGLRYGELFGLARRHVDLEQGTVRVERALVIRSGHAPTFGPTKTARSRRTVHLTRFVLAALRTHLAHNVPAYPDALLFTVASTGNPVTTNYLSDLMHHARAAIGREDLTWHDLRHTGATLAYRAGASVREVQNRLGHTTQRAAAIYQHAADDSDRALADRLDALRESARPNEFSTATLALSPVIAIS